MATQLLSHWEDPKPSSTCLAHEWHVQVAAHLKFKGDNIVKVSKPETLPTRKLKYILSSRNQNKSKTKY